MDDKLSPRVDVKSGWRGSTNIAKQINSERKKRESVLFITEAKQKDLDELTTKAPFSFEYVPTTEIMKKLIIRATQITNINELD